MLIQNEEQYQAECFKWYWNTYKDKMLFAVDNNISKRVWGLNRIIEGNRKKSIGVQADVSDFVYSGFWYTAFIELKMWDGYQSPGQKQFQLDVEYRGHQYFICKCERYDDQLLQFKVLIQILKDEDATNRSKRSNQESQRQNDIR